MRAASEATCSTRCFRLDINFLKEHLAAACCVAREETLWTASRTMSCTVTRLAVSDLEKNTATPLPRLVGCRAKTKTRAMRAFMHDVFNIRPYYRHGRTPTTMNVFNYLSIYPSSKHDEPSDARLQRHLPASHHWRIIFQRRQRVWLRAVKIICMPPSAPVCFVCHVWRTTTCNENHNIY